MQELTEKEEERQKNEHKKQREKKRQEAAKEKEGATKKREEAAKERIMRKFLPPRKRRCTGESSRNEPAQTSPCRFKSTCRKLDTETSDTDSQVDSERN